MTNITENQQALANSIGLKFKDLGYNKLVLVKDTVGEEVPTKTELSDIYYPSLAQHVVSQEVNESIRTFALTDRIFKKEEWINGVKEFLSNSLLPVVDYDKTITIDDFNPADPVQITTKFSIDYTNFVPLKYTVNEILQAFTTPASLEAFVNQIIGRCLNSINYVKQNLKAAILGGADSVTIYVDTPYEKTFDVMKIVPDQIYDVTGMEAVDIVELIQHIMISLGTASPDWLALEDSRFIYSATPANLDLMLRPAIKSALLKAGAGLYNASTLITEKIQNAALIDILRAGTAESGTWAWLVDNEALRIGYQVEDLYWNINVPKTQKLMEVHNWFGFASIPSLFKAVFTTEPDTWVATVEAVRKNNKIYRKAKVIKGKDVIKNILTIPNKK